MGSSAAAEHNCQVRGQRLTTRRCFYADDLFWYAPPFNPTNGEGVGGGGGLGVKRESWSTSCESQPPPQTSRRSNNT